MNNRNNNIRYTEFKIRAMGRAELALAYFPGSKPRAARQRLWSYITRCKQLYETLREKGMTDRQKYFTPAMVEAIVYYLGEP